MLIPASMINDNSLLEAANLVDGDKILGGTNQFQTNTYGDLTLGGVSNTTYRILQVKPGLDFDLDFITEGLTAKTYLAVDFINNIQTFQDNTYAIYERSYETDTLGKESLVVEKYGIDEKEDNRINWRCSCI